MKSLFTFVFVFAVLFSFASGITENNNDKNKNAKETAASTISGKILDSETKEALAGVKISVGDSQLTVYTDFDGNFELSIPAGLNEKDIKISFISYEETTLTFSDKNDNTIEINQIF